MPGDWNFRASVLDSAHGRRMVAQVVPVVSGDHGTDSMGLRSAVQSGREDVCDHAARAVAGVFVVQGVAGKVCGIDGATAHYSSTVPGARTVGSVADARRGAARRTGRTAAGVV